MQIKHFLNYLYAYIDVIGKVAIKLPGVGKIQGFVASKLGWFIVVLLPAMGVIIYDIFKILKLVKSKKIVDNISGDNNKEQINANKQIDITAEQLRKTDYLKQLEELKNFEYNSIDISICKYYWSPNISTIKRIFKRY